MNYSGFKKIANNLLKKFGNSQSCLLIKTKNNIQEIYKGVCVKLNYTSEMVDGNIIKMGDAKVICQFDVEPTEMTDILRIENQDYSIISVNELAPDGRLRIVYTLQVRKM